MLLLRRSIRDRIGATGPGVPFLLRLWTAAFMGAGLAWVVKVVLPPVHPVLQAIAVLVPYGAAYLLLTAAMRIPEASGALRRVLRLRARTGPRHVSKP
jgi:hypothetical protein